MNTKAFKILSLVVAFLAFGLQGQAKEDDFTKEIKESYNVDSGALLELDCSFSTIEIEESHGQSVDIYISVSVEAKSERDAEDYFDNIDIQVKGNSRHVEINSSLNSGNRKNIDFDILIKISAPSDIKLKSNVAFGDLQIGEIAGTCDITQEYGDFKATALKSTKNEVKISFGNGRIVEFGGGELSVEFGGCEIERLTGDSEMLCSYSELEIDRVTSTCRNLELDCSFGDIEVSLDQDCSFKIEASASMGDISLDRGIEITRETNDWNSERYEARIGSGEGKMEVECSFGDVDVLLR